MNKRIKQVWVLTIITGILVIGGQFYWLYNQYCYSINDHIKTLRERIEVLEKNEFEQRDHKLGNLRDYRIEYRFLNSTSKQKLSEKLPKISLDGQDTNLVQSGAKPLTKNIYNLDTIRLKSKSIDIENINEAARRLKTERHTPFKKERFDSLLHAQNMDVSRIDTIRTDSIQWLSTYQKEGSFLSPLLKVTYPYSPLEKKAVTFSIDIPLNPIIVEMIWQLLGSLLLTMMLTFCLIFQIKTILKQRKIDELRKNFVNTMIHELKRPVQTLKMCIAFLKNKNLVRDEKAMNEVVMDAMFELDNLSAYLAKVRDMTRADYENTPLNIRSFDLRETVEKIIRLNVAPSNKEVSIDATFNTDNCLVTADPVHIANVISNLIENAIKYSQNKVAINIACTLNNHLLELVISDNGIGIPLNEQSRVFDKFYRGHTASSSNIPGIGLGLSYVKLLTEAHKGTIHMKSQVGIGTTFTIEIPQ